MENKKFKTLTESEKRDRFSRILRLKTGDKLSNSQINQITAVTKGEQCRIRVAHDPDAFSNMLMLKNSAAEKVYGTERHEETGLYIYGDYSFGVENIMRDVIGARRNQKNAHFNREMPAAAFIRAVNTGFKDLNVFDNDATLLIYIPDESDAVSQNVA